MGNLLNDKLGDLKRLINEVDAATQQKTQPDKITSQEFAEAVKEMNDKEGVQKTSETIAALVYKQITEEAPRQDLSGIIMPYDGMYSLNDGPVYQREGEPLLYWLGDETEYIELKRTTVMRTEQTMQFDSIYVFFEYNVDQLEAGKFGDFQKQINKARNQFVGAANMLMWKSLTDAKGSGDASGTFNLTALQTALEWVEDNSELGTKAILARTTTLSDMTFWNSSAGPSAGGREHGIFSDMMKDKAWNNLTLDSFRGIPVVGIKKHNINVNRSKYQDQAIAGMIEIPSGDILVVPSDDFAYFAEQGPIRVMSDEDAKSRTRRFSMGRRMGVIVFKPLVYYWFDG